MSTEKPQMHEIKIKVDRLEEVVEDSLSAQRETNQQLGELVTLMKVKEEREKRQEEINVETNSKLYKMDNRLSTIELGRAEEKQSRAFLMKWWPILLLVATAGSAAVTAFFSGLGRGLSG